MWTTRAIELWALGFFFALSASAGSVEIDCSYPGGNVKVVKVDEAKGVVDFAPDLRDTAEDWFWFNFRVRGVEGRTLTFVGAPGYPRLGPLGQASGTAAVLALERDVAVQDVPYPQLRERLVREGMVLNVGE